MDVLRKSATLLLIIVLLGAAAVSAAGFEFLPDPVTDRKQILENRGFTLLEEPPRKFSIECFDVNEDGLIAIGTQKGETKIISICDSDGVFQYGFTCQDTGDFGLQWEKDEVLFYSVRSDLAFRVSASGDVKEIRKIANTIENNAHWHHVVFADERIVGADRYYLKDDMGILNYMGSSHAQLAVVHADSTEQILYDVNSELLVQRSAVIVFVLLFIGIVFYSLFKLFKKLKSDAEQ